MSLTRSLSEAAHAVVPAALSDEVVTCAKMHVLDGIAAGLDASLLAPLFDPAIAILARWGGPGRCSVFGKKEGFAPRYAAFINSFTMISSPYQETHRASLAHPYSPVLSTALALGEERGSSGGEMIAAVVAGYETLLRVATAVSPSLLERGIQTTGAVAPIGAATVAAKLMELDRDQLRHAINHGANFGAGSLVEAHGAKPYFGVQVGANTEKGILAAELAAAGVVGCDTILEGGSVSAKGFLQAYSDAFDTDVITHGWGDRFGIQETGFSFHYVASFSRTPIDALLALVAEHGLSADDIARLEVKLTSVLYNFVNQRIESTANRAGHYYIPLHMALTLLHGGVDAERLNDEAFQDPQVRKIMDTVVVSEDRSLDADYGSSKAVTAAVVEITTRDGRVLSRRQDTWRGDPANPASWSDIESKFRRVTRRAIPPQTADKIVDMVARLEDLDTVAPLAALIRQS